MKPAFAVVGHPNKGKSSIVATLAQNDSVAISAMSGTTKSAQQLEVFIGELSYLLIDTPGFQRPTKVLKWLEQHATSADTRPDAVLQFLANDECKALYRDEIELLSPIMEGAAILYVVDGSRPYAPEYEAEMEILRWTGQASLALINPIENEDHIDQWKHALGQYFKVVKVFNAMDAEFDKQLSVLQALAHIRHDWQTSVEAIVDASKNRARQRKHDAAQLAADLLTQASAYQISQKVLNKEQGLQLKSSLELAYYKKIKDIESTHHESLKSLLSYHHLQSTAEELPKLDNLFDTQKWIVWGLTRQQLTTAAAMAGAAAGAVIDLALAGSSLLLGALGGGAVGAAGAWMGADKLADYSIKGLPVGGYNAIQGPMKNRNFPYVLLGRFLHLEEKLANRTHAQRSEITISEGKLQEKISALSDADQKALHSALDKLSKQKSVEGLNLILLPLLSK